MKRNKRLNKHPAWRKGTWLRDNCSCTENTLWEKAWLTLNQEFTVLFIHVISSEKCSLYQSTLWFTGNSLWLSRIEQSQELHRQDTHPSNTPMTFNSISIKIKLSIPWCDSSHKIISQMEVTKLNSPSDWQDLSAFPGICPLWARILFRRSYFPAREKLSFLNTIKQHLSPVLLQQQEF